MTEVLIPGQRWHGINERDGCEFDFTLEERFVAKHTFPTPAWNVRDVKTIRSPRPNDSIAFILESAWIDPKFGWTLTLLLCERCEAAARGAEAHGAVGFILCGACQERRAAREAAENRAVREGEHPGPWRYEDADEIRDANGNQVLWVQCGHDNSDDTIVVANPHIKELLLLAPDLERMLRQSRRTQCRAVAIEQSGGPPAIACDIDAAGNICWEHERRQWIARLDEAARR